MFDREFGYGNGENDPELEFINEILNGPCDDEDEQQQQEEEEGGG